MQERYTSNGVIERGYAIYDEWNENKYKSRKIVNSVQMAVASSNAKKTPDSHVTALSHLFALDLRIKERYDNIFKCIILYFSWRRETVAFKRFKDILKLPEVDDFRDIIELEVERLHIIDKDKNAGSDKKPRGGRVTEFSGEEAAKVGGDELAESVAEETLEEGRNTEKNEEKSEKLAASEQTGEQSRDASSDAAEDVLVVTERPQEKNSGSSDSGRTEINQERLFENNTENNGFDKKSEPSINKEQIKQDSNGAADANIYYEVVGHRDEASQVSFIDDVILDNMIKGESDIIGHNPLEDVKQNSGELSRSSELPVGEVNKDGKDAHLYDKMVLDGKGDGAKNDPNASQSEQKEKNEQKEQKAPQGEQKDPNPSQEKSQVLNDKRDDKLRVQINVQENVSEENVFRRSVNDKYNDKMIHFHKSLMEEALREDLKIIDLGLDAPLRLIEESNFKEYQENIALGKKH